MSAHRAVLVASIVLAGSVVGPGAPAVALGHGGIGTVQGHGWEDSAPHDRAVEPQLSGHTSAATAIDAATAAAAVTGVEADVGQWGPVVDWPVVGIHNALLSNGKVLAYDSIGDKATETYAVHDRTRATVWDPATGSHTPVNVNTGYNVFCSGLAHLTDGSLFLAGGNKNAQLDGIVQTHVFNSTTNAWRLGPNMAADRWYPTVTPLRNGEMLITEGGPDMPEVRTTAGGLRALSTASLNLPLYPWMDVAPDGRAFYSGPGQTMRALNTTGGGTWQSFGQRDSINRDYGSHAVYDVGKILVAGGGPSSKDARVIDISGATPQVSATAPMANGRRQHNLTVLADGTVLATGGNSSGASLVDLANGVYPAELWSPATGQWRTLAAMQVTRQYHSTALLLSDGRVLSSGGGICGTCDAVGYLAKNAEVFTPPYLFKKDGSGELAPRPAIDAAPDTATYGAPFDIATPDAASIRKVALVRLGAVTHSVNMEQRYVPLAFTAGSASVTATGPRDANVAPPGPYMLFVIDADGVPSVARIVTVAGNSAPGLSLTQPAGGATFTAPATVSIAASASDADGTVTMVEFFNGTTKLGEDTTAPYSHTWTGVGAGTYSLTARATDDAGATTTSAASTITVSATLTFGADADARVQEANPTTNYGTSYVRTDGATDPDVDSYLRFTVSGAASITGAKLRVYATSASSNGPAVYTSSATTWSESAITWANRPARTTTPTADKGAVSANTWVEFDVRPLVSGNGIYTFVLATDSTDGLNMNSREATNTALRPQLVLQSSPATQAPTAEFTASPTTGTAPLTVRFTDGSTGATSWAWDFQNDDSFETTDRNPQYTYTQPGTYTVRLQVENEVGGDEEIKTGYIVVQAPSPGGTPITFNAVADSYVKSDAATQNNGTSSRVRVDAVPAVNAYTRFQVTGLSASPRATKLRLYVLDAGAAGGSVYPVSNDWIESGTGGITWNNAPPITGSALSTAGPAVLDAFTEWDVTSAIQGNGTYSFAVKGNSSDSVYFASRENTRKPELVVTP